MNAKKILVALLGLATTATWGPQVWDQIQKSNEPEVQLPPAESVGALAVSSSPVAAPRTQASSNLLARPGANVSAPSPGTSVAAGQLSSGESQAASPPKGQLDDLLGVLQTFVGGRSGGLDELLSERPSWLDTPASEEDSSDGESTASVVQELVAKESSATEARTSRKSTVEAFLADAPLTAIVRSETESWAMIGGRIVREGDVLLPKLLKVGEISAHGVSLTTPDGDLELPLPPFQAASQKSNSGTEGPPEPEESGAPHAPEASSFPTLDPS